MAYLPIKQNVHGKKLEHPSASMQKALAARDTMIASPANSAQLREMMHKSQRAIYRPTGKTVHNSTSISARKLRVSGFSTARVQNDGCAKDVHISTNDSSYRTVLPNPHDQGITIPLELH